MRDTLRTYFRRVFCPDLVAAAEAALALIEEFDSEARDHGGDDCGWPEQIEALRDALN